MKHKHQMSLIARRAQIRRATANRKDIPEAQPAARPVLRLVSINHSIDREQRNEQRALASTVE